MAAAAVASLLAIAVGFATELGRFGWSESAALARLDAHVAGLVAERTRTIEAVASRVARQGDLVAAAADSREQLPELFRQLSDPFAGSAAESASATVWVTAVPAGTFRVLAWSDGPGEDSPADVLTRAPALVVRSGAGGLRLVHVRPILVGDQRVGVAAAESVLSLPARAGGIPPRFTLTSPVGPLDISVATPADDPAAASAARRVITDAAGAPLLVLSVRPGQIQDSRRLLRWRIAVAAAVPWALWSFFLAARVLRNRAGTPSWHTWLTRTAAGTALFVASTTALIWLAERAGLPDVWRHLPRALMTLAAAAVIAGGAWWRPVPSARRHHGMSPAWILEQLAGGIVLAGTLALMAWLWRDRLNPTSIEKWQLPVLASDVVSIAALAAVLIAQVALSWTAAGTLGMLAARWGLSWRRTRGWIAAVIWAAPSALLPRWLDEPVPAAAAAVVVTAAVFGLVANAVRRQYHTSSEARRLVYRFAALIVPILAAYPLAAGSADRATRALIERDYGPATAAAQEPDVLVGVLDRAREEVDRIETFDFSDQGNGPIPSQAAFTVWSQTVLSRDRVTSELELYGPDRALVSRFALNVPEFGSLYQSGELIWQGKGCGWASFAETARFGAGERRMLHAERGICAPDGTFLGAVVLHVIPDFRALPFVSSADPYFDVLRGPDPQRAGSRIAELQVVAYGWSLQPVFTSGRIAWSIDPEIDQQLYASRTPFWADREAGDRRRFHVYFLNNRIGVYALGYPVPTALQHVTRLAEAAAVLVGLLVLYLFGGALIAPVLQHAPTALPALAAEIRASFYRKLFLFFVLAAVGPVVLFAIAFGSYMADKLRLDVETEAGNVVTVARRVFDELTAAQAPPGQSRLGPSDDVMVWIRQVVDQDVNLYEGPSLVATSQRDLFDSGLLPTRTPATIYRQIVLDRRPVVVEQDSIGGFRYLMAAAPIQDPLRREAMLSVPLALRQREIEREIDELTRGVLAGTVVLVLFAAALGASVAARVSDPVARLTRATRLVAAGRYDERLPGDTADELGRLVHDFNTMTETLERQRAELARANQLKAWAEMSRQVAHEVKNPLTPIQLAAEHLQRVHEDRDRPLGGVVDRCVDTILTQVRLLRRIASEFSTFATQPKARLEAVDPLALVGSVVEPYRAGLPDKLRIGIEAAAGLPLVKCDRTLTARAITNLVENGLQAMPAGGQLTLRLALDGEFVRIEVADTGVGMDDEAVQRAFEPYFSTKTGGSGLGLANAKRNVELSGGTVTLASRPGTGTLITVRLPIALPASAGSA